MFFFPSVHHSANHSFVGFFSLIFESQCALLDVAFIADGCSRSRRKLGDRGIFNGWFPVTLLITYIYKYNTPTSQGHIFPASLEV